jgi:hypothetical protein
LLDRLKGDLGPTAVIEVNHDLLESLTCATCNETTPLLASLGRITESQARCPRCTAPRRPNMYHTISEESNLLDRTLNELGIPPWDILGGRAGMQQRFYEFAGDMADVLGELADAPPLAPPPSLRRPDESA